MLKIIKVEKNNIVEFLQVCLIRSTLEIILEANLIFSKSPFNFIPILSSLHPNIVLTISKFILISFQILLILREFKV